MVGSGDAIDQPRPLDQDAAENRPGGSRTIRDQKDDSGSLSTKKTACDGTQPRDGKRPRQKGSLAVATAGLEIGLAIVGLTLLGRWLDDRYGSTPWLMLVGLGIGMIGGTYNVWKIGRSFFDD